MAYFGDYIHLQFSQFRHFRFLYCDQKRRQFDATPVCCTYL